MSEVNSPRRYVDSDTLKAFSHPLRMRMYDYLKDHGSATASMLARALGESSGQTSYHLRQLERHGLVSEDTERGSARERWWRPEGFSYGLESIVDDESKLAAAVTLQHWSRRAAELQVAWADAVDGEDEAWSEAAINAEASLSLTADELAALTQRLQAALDEAVEEVAATRDKEAAGQRRVKVFIHAFPLAAEDQPSVVSR
ncbi:helix-turn-helix domain-containing protein [Tessaracoccus lacteus]|uniref:Helix-turn-helix domain-containing protein n=1 Tax=Tessaracoccus lacteus TaxID=3041766 RepID=A0ABY8PY43_9ACTN|nr:helix-turn-helix domain-containing protein [Tessaracoccus sp. T21]WGT47389.1 helix-turn-helix domain-containing protein [Tessaracoccus sp. T21]